MTEDVVAWLRELGLSQYAGVLAANEFDTLEDVASLTADDLTELGITKVGARKKLLAASSALLLNGVDRNNYYQQLAQKFANERKSNPGTPTPPRPSSLPSVASPIAYTKTPSKSSSLSYSRDNDISPSITKSPNADGWVDDFLNSKSIVSPLTNNPKQNTTQEEKKTNHVNEINHQPTKNQINHLPSTSKMVAELSPSQFPSLGLMFHALPTNTTGLVYLDHLQHATGFQNVKTPDQILQKNNQYSALDTMFHLLPDINKNMKGLETLKRSSKIPESQQQDTKRKQSMTDTLPVNEVEDKLILAVNKENQTLEELLDEASNLLVDNPNSPRVRMMGSAPIREIRPLPMTVADIRKRMEDRIREYEQKDNAIYNSENNTKSLSKLFNVKANKTDYHKLLADQQKQIRGMEIAHKIYRRLVDQSLNAWQSNSDTMVVGIVKDTTEIRLKRQLQKQIHLLPPDAPDMDEDGHILDVVPEDAEIAARRRVALGKIEEEIKRITNTLDNNGDGILQPDELKAAMELNESLKEQLQTIAINLAFSPENRYQTLDSSYNREVQEQLDAIAAQIDTDGDGFLSPQELKQMTEENKRKLDMMGLALKLK